MGIVTAFAHDIADPEELRALLAEYFGVIAAKLDAIGGPEIDPESIAAGTVADPGGLLPPAHRLLLARDAGGRLAGCGCLRRIRDDAAEMKRMYVRPEARGQGLGTRLFTERLEEARRMGLSRLYADTVRGNRAMLSIYERHGFRYIDRYPENANPPEWSRWLVYLEREI